MAIYVTGDTHGPRSIGIHSVDGYMPRLNTSAFPEQRDLGKEDYVIICGDFGGIWDTDRVAFRESSEECNGLDWLEGKPFTTLFVPGNHENYDRLTGIRDERILGSWLYEKMPLSEKQRLREGYPHMEWHGGPVRQIRPSVLMLEPGVFDLGGMKVFAYGGAASHDISGGILNPADYADKKAYKEAFDKAYRRGISFRVKGISWWEQEQPDRAKDEIVANEYDLSINQYRQTEYVSVEYLPTSEIIAKIPELEKQRTAEMKELANLLKE